MHITTRIFLGLTFLCGIASAADPLPVRVLVWDERQPKQKEAYDGGFLGDAIAAHLTKLPGMTVKSVALDSPEQGLDTATLDATDVIVWWGHVRHREITQAHVDDVASRVRAGRLGFIPLHSAHWC